MWDEILIDTEDEEVELSSMVADGLWESESCLFTIICGKGDTRLCGALAVIIRTVKQIESWCCKRHGDLKLAR